MLNLVEDIKKRARLILMANKPQLECYNYAKNFINFRFIEGNYKDY